MAAMWILATFLLGIGNFALHKAVLESRHPVIEQIGIPRMAKLTLGLEFAALLGALLLVANGYSFWGWAYLGYSLFNAGSGWLILTRRV
jgi:hypothetical protein